MVRELRALATVPGGSRFDSQHICHYVVAHNFLKFQFEDDLIPSRDLLRCHTALAEAPELSS